jgi:hypothetical protein
MRIPTSLHAGVAARGIAVVGIAAMAAAPLAPVTQSQSPPTVARDVRLADVTVPLGGLLTSFLGNQLIYCSLICPLLVETAVTPVVTTLGAPGTFLTALQSGNLLKAIGVAAASVTGPTNAAAEQAILVDSEIPAQRALNAFETAVVGLLNVPPAAAGGLPGIITALQTFREQTFAALNAPVVPNPPPTVMPQGVLQVAVVGAINVGASVIFPAFNDVLSGLFETPDAAAQELAATGNPVLAVGAAVKTVAGVVTAAATVIANAIVTAISNIGAATPLAVPAKLAVPANQTVQLQKAATTTTQAPAKVAPLHPSVTTTTNHANVHGPGSHPLRAVGSNLRQTVRSVVKKASAPPHHAASK